MALIRTLNTAVSGLRNHQIRIDTIGNNIANVNTTAFKASRTQFQSQFHQTLTFGSAAAGNLGGVNPQQVGLGMQLASISEDFSQGAMETTGVASDLAIEGDGFFILNDNAGAPVYTRDGTFRRNISNEMVSPASGFKVQGWLADASFNINTGGVTSTILVPVGTMSIANQTTTGTMVGNLSPKGSLALNGTVTGVSLFAGVPAATGATLMTAVTATSGGPVLFTAGDSITVAAKKGGRSVPTGSFSVTATATVADFMTFLDQMTGLNSAAGTFGANRLGTNLATTTAATATTITDTAQNFVTSGVAVGDTIRLTSGTLAGTTAVVTAVAATTLTCAAGFSGAGTPAVGDKFSVHKPVGVAINAAGLMQISGNLGTQNAITDLVVTRVPVAGVNSTPFTFTQTSAADGESAHTSFTVYDSLGRPHIVDLTLTEELQNSTTTTWRYYADAADDSDVDLVVGTGTVTFSTTGQFSSTAPLNNQISIDFAAMGVATPEVVSLNFAKMTMLGDGPSDVNLQDQDGFAMGVLNSFSVGQDGVVTGVFSNGLTRSIAQVALARFANNNGLVSQGKNLYGIGTNSGPAQVGAAGASGRGLIKGGTLEEANVELSKEFTDLITTQRGFQANARVISVADDMLNELVNLRR